MAIENINSNNPLDINDLDPLLPSNTPLTTTTTNNTNTPNTDSLQTSNTPASGSNALFIKGSGNPTLYPPLIDILNAVKDATYASKRNTYESSTAMNELTAQFYSNLVSNAEDFVSRMNDLVNLQGQSFGITEEANAEIDKLNAAAEKYNTENGSPAQDNAQVQAMNTAISNYNSAFTNLQIATAQWNANPKQIDEGTYNQYIGQYNNAVDAYNNQLSTYNNYKGARNQTIDAFNSVVNEFNSETGDINNRVATVNQDRQSYGQDPLQNLSAASPVPRLPDLPGPGGSTIPTINYSASDKSTQEKMPDIDPSESLNTLNVLIFDIVSTLAFTQQSTAQISNQQEKTDYFLRVKPNLVTLPAAFSSQQTSATTSTTGSGSNVGFGAVSAALDPVINSQVMNESQQNANYLQAGVRDNDPAFNYGLAQKRLEILLNLKGAVELTPLIDQAGNNDPEATGTAFRQALSVGVATDRAQVLSQVGIGSSDEALANLRTLGYDLSNISTQLSSPDLGIQILGLAGLSTTDLFNVTAQGVNAKEFLNDPFAGPVVKENLINGIGTALGGSDLRTAVTAALNDAIGSTSSYSNSEALVSQFQNSLINQGVSSSDAAIASASLSSQLDGAAFTSRTDFRDSVQQSLVSQGFSNDDALALASESAGISPLATDDATLAPRNLDANLFLSNLAFNLTLQNVTTPSEIAQNVAQKLLENTQEVSEATFRDDLEKELVNQGLNQDEARRVASGVGIPLSADSSSSQAAVRTDLVASLQGVYGPLVNTQDATQRAQHNADNLVGPANTNARAHYDDSHPTLVNVIRSNFEYVKTQSDNETYAKAIDSFRDYLKPTIELYASQEIARNPASFYMEATSIQHGADAKTGGVKMGGTSRALDLPA